MQGLKEKIDEAVNFIKTKVKMIPRVAIILGTGLNTLAEAIERKIKIPYQDIPNFPIPTVKSHKAELVVGEISDKAIVAMQGRFHYYEGYSLEEVVFPVRVMRNLGTDILIVSNAAGGLNPNFNLSDIMIITDHINLTGLNPLIGPNDERLGLRFPDMLNCYSEELIKLTEDIAIKEGIKIYKGVYLGVTGPSLETRAEYRFMRQIGADAVGMSTVPEVIVAVHCGFKILGISCITDRCLPDALEPADINKILKAASDAKPKLTKLVRKIIEKISV